jgi:LPXTG-motif cell wall-anchored protein
LNIPSTHSAGSYVVRVSTSYANSGQPNSTASDSVTLTSAGAPVTPVSPGGGGGGGGSAPITGKVIPKTEHMLDLNIQIPEDYLNVYAGSKVLTQITIYNLGTEEIKDAKLYYYIKNSEGEIITSDEETIAIFTKIQVVKELLLPENVQPGTYYFYTNISYNNETATSKTSFKVLEPSAGKQITEAISKPRNYWYIILGILIILAGIVYFLKRRQHEYERPRYKQKSLLNKRNVIISVSILAILASAFLISKFGLMTDIKLPTINLWTILASIGVLVLIGIFVVLIFIFLRMRRRKAKIKPQEFRKPVKKDEGKYTMINNEKYLDLTKKKESLNKIVDYMKKDIKDKKW